MNTVRTLRIRRAAGAATIGLLVLVLWLLLRPDMSSVPPSTATLEIVNPTARTWQIRTTSVPTGNLAECQIGPGETRRLELTGGEYTIDQVLLAPPGQPGSTRTLQSSFKAGETYRWTLLALPRPDLDGQPRP